GWVRNAGLRPANCPASIDHDEHRQALNSIRLPRLTVNIVKRRKLRAERAMVPLDPFGRDPLVDVDPEHRDPISVSLMNLIQSGDRLSTRTAPAGPEIQHDDLPSKRRNRYAVAFGGALARNQRKLDARSGRAHQ